MGMKWKVVGGESKEWGWFVEKEGCMGLKCFGRQVYLTSQDGGTVGGFERKCSHFSMNS